MEMLEHVKNLYRELNSQQTKQQEAKQKKGKPRETEQKKTKRDTNELAPEAVSQTASQVASQAASQATGNADFETKQVAKKSPNKRKPAKKIEQELQEPIDEELPISLQTHLAKTKFPKSPFQRTYDELLTHYGEIPPREKLELFGTQNLSNEELVSLLLGSGSKGQPVAKLAAKVFSILARDPFATSLESLRSIKGMGMSKSSLVLAAMELGRRLLCPNPRKLNNPDAIFRNVAHFADQQENLIALNLNGACEMISIRLVTRGTVNRSLIHPREVFSYAVREQAHSVVIAHNHPSGHLEPSQDDLRSTQRLLKAGEVLGIKLLDHLIFSETTYLSLVEEGYLKH